MPISPVLGFTTEILLERSAHESFFFFTNPTTISSMEPTGESHSSEFAVWEKETSLSFTNQT